MSVNRERKKLVAIHTKIADLAIGQKWAEIDRVIRIVAARSQQSVVVAAFLATHCISTYVDREPLSEFIRKMK
jgi:hypothetical protein